MMNTTIRAGMLAVAMCCATAGLYAQASTIQEDLARADKQFDLYAYNLALRTYDQVLQQQPNNAHALARTGDCYFQLNRPQEALSWYDRAALREDVEPETLLQYGKTLMQTGDYVGAKKWFLLYAEGNPQVGQHYAQMCDFAMQASKKAPLFQALNEPLNTEASDYAPAFFTNKLVYNSARTDIKRQTASKTSTDWTGSAYNQLYVTQRNPGDNYLQTPAFLHSDLENTYNEGPVSFSGDGKRVAYCRNNFIDGTRQIADKGLSMSLLLADVVDGRWLNERTFPYNGSNCATGFPCFSPDGTTLYFASNQEGGFGGWDLYVSSWNGFAWTTPRNLGPNVNTKGNEVTPFFDGTNLYFSSDWHKGLGGLDVFRADIQDNNAGNVVHLGTGINSSRDDYGFILDPATGFGYLTSTRPEGRGNEDIWQVRKKVDEFVITVTDNRQNPVDFADIDFSACNAGIKQTDAFGRYAFAVATGKADCRITVRKNGYLAATAPVSSAGEKNIRVVLVPTAESSATTPATTSAATTGELPSLETPATYSTTTYPVTTGAIEKYTVYVSDDQGRPLQDAELNLTTCGLGSIYTDISGKGSFYFPKGNACNLIIRKSGLEDIVIPVNAQTRKEMSVAMSADQRTKFAGVVMDADTRRPIQGTIATARSRNGTHETLASSNASGQYTLLLRPYQVYDITYTHDGYSNYVSTLQTDRAVKADMELSPVFMTPAALSPASAPATYSTTAQPGGMISLADLEKLPSVPATTATQAMTPAPKTTGYSIQLSARPEKYTETYLKKYENLTEYGNLYAVKEGNMNKLRLGIYPTKEEANAVLAKVDSKTKDAFVVYETQGQEDLVVKPATEQAPLTYSTIAAKGLSSTPASKTALPGTTALHFAVQVMSLAKDDPVVFTNYANLSSLGNVYVRQENDRLRVRVGTYDVYEKAEAAQTQALAMGYKDAVIVTEKAESGTAAAPATYSTSAPIPVSKPAGPSTTAVIGGIAAPATYSTKTPAQYSTATAPVQYSTTSSNAKYYIRVCSLEDKQNFDAKKLEGAVGTIEKWPIGDTKMTAVMLTGLPSLDQAKATTDRLRTKGFKDAYIIQDENGKMSRFRY